MFLFRTSVSWLGAHNAKWICNKQRVRGKSSFEMRELVWRTLELICGAWTGNTIIETGGRNIVLFHGTKDKHMNIFEK